MALSSNKIRATRGADGISFIAKNGEQFYAGSLVGIDANGYAVKWGDVTGNKFLGFSQGKVLGNTSISPAPRVEVNTSGVILEKVSVTGASGILDLGKKVYGTDDDTLTLTATTNVGAIGFVVGWHSGTICDVKLFTPTEFLLQ